MKVSYGRHSGELPDWISAKRDNGFAPRRTLRLSLKVGQSMPEGLTEDRVHEDFARWGELECVKRNPEEKEIWVNFLDITNATRAQKEVGKDTEYAAMSCDFREDPCESESLGKDTKAPSKMSVRSLGEWRLVPKPEPPKPTPVYDDSDDCCCRIM